MVLGGWLDWMILEVFSNLWFYESLKAPPPHVALELLGHLYSTAPRTSGTQCRSPWDGRGAAGVVQALLLPGDSQAALSKW